MANREPAEYPRGPLPVTLAVYLARRHAQVLANRYRLGCLHRDGFTFEQRRLTKRSREFLQANFLDV